MIFFLRAFRRNTRLRRRLFRTSAIAPFLRLRYGTPAAVLHSLTHFIKRISLSQEKTQTETKIPRFSKTTACAFRLKPFPDSDFSCTFSYIPWRLQFPQPFTITCGFPLLVLLKSLETRYPSCRTFLWHTGHLRTIPGFAKG